MLFRLTDGIERQAGLQQHPLNSPPCSDFPKKLGFAHFNSRVSDQNGVSQLYIIVEIHHSGQKPSNLFLDFYPSP